MSFTIQKTLPSKSEVKAKFPLTENLQAQIAQDRQEVMDILSGQDDRKILIIGPCSAWPNTAVLEYAEKLAPLAEKYAPKLKIIMRSYIQKPRTTVGWQGPIVQPDPFGEPDMSAGIFYCREMMLEIVKMGLPISDEILFPRKNSYFRDLFTWAAIGARSSENQEHRVLSSMLEFPIGLKNSTSGSLSVATNSVLAAQTPNYLALDGMQVQTSGNPYAHLVLRGGRAQPNTAEERLLRAASLCKEKNIQNPGFIIDASHENSRDPETGQKNPLRQPQVIFETLKTCEQNPVLKPLLKGWMVESFLVDGKQKVCKGQVAGNKLQDKREKIKEKSTNGNIPNTKETAPLTRGKASNSSEKQEAGGLIYGQSITDGCLGWEKTEALLEELYGRLT